MSSTQPTLGDFSPQASSYAAARPGYPAQLIDQLIRYVGIRPGQTVADIGAGTGLFTSELARRGFSVTAIEPTAAMREQAPPWPNVRWVDGTFENTGLADGSQTWLTAAQALHWAKPLAALPELRRILTDGGHLTVLWNNRINEQSPVLQWTMAALAEHVPGFRHEYRRGDWTQVLQSTGDFRAVVVHEAAHTVAMSRDRYLALWQSHNRLAVTAGPERLAQFLAAIADHLDRQNITTINVPYLCRAWTARRLARK